MYVKIIKKENIKVLNTMEKDMDMELFTIVKEENILENGVKIKCKDKEHCFILLKNQHIKDNGKMINYKDMEFCIMNKLVY